MAELRLIQDSDALPLDHCQERRLQFLFSFLACKSDRQTGLQQQPSRPLGPRLPVLDLDREKVLHDAGVALGVDDVGNQEIRSRAVMHLNPGQPLERRRALLVEPEDSMQRTAENMDPHGAARDRKARLVEILANSALGELKADQHDRSTATSRDLFDHGPSVIGIPNLALMVCGVYATAGAGRHEGR